MSAMGPKKRASISSPSLPAQMKFSSGPEVTRATAKGTKPLPEPTSVGETLTKVVVYLCKRILFLQPKIRLTAYAVLFFFASLVADYAPIPKSYFSSSGNIPNQYFVKFSWAWTFILVGVFVYLTSAVYCVGEKRKMLRQFSRLAIGTVVWYVWTNIFRIIEESTGQCKTTDGPLYTVQGRRACGAKNGKWSSFDISGHAFLLLWCVLFITEEAKAILGWDSIKDFIRKEDYNRRQNSLANPADPFSDTPLNNLAPEQFDKLRETYGKNYLLANILLVFLTGLVILWDMMMVATALYFHVMLEKVIGALIAALSWYVLYRVYYKSNFIISPGLPGLGGLVRYSPIKGSSVPMSSSVLPPTNKSTSSKGTGTTPANLPKDIPHFMGMPIYPRRNRPEDNSMGEN